MNDKHAANKIGRFIRDNVMTKELFLRVSHLIDNYIRKIPSPYHLTILKGYLILMTDDVPLEGDILSLVKKYYQEAVAINPNLPEAHIELGYHFDVFEDNFIEAECSFKRAIQSGGQADAYIGLFRVLAQQGKGKINEIHQIESNLSQEIRLSCTEILEEINNGIWFTDSIKTEI